MPARSPRSTLAVLATAELLAMSLWFTGTAVVPQLKLEWRADLATASWLTIAVQLGFVAGALASAALNLPDVFSPARVFVISSLAAAAVNAMFAAWAAEHAALALLFRFLTGAFLAGVYPTGMKLLAGWFREGRGLALGVLVGALTIGSAMPHALAATSDILFHAMNWRPMVLASSGLAVVAALLVACFVREGPYAAPQPPFRFAEMSETWRNPRLRLANLGYLGHMWELYSMWGWMAVLLASAASSQIDSRRVELLAFAVIAIGMLGCIWAGRASDRIGESSRIAQRANVTIIAMAASGACCILAALAFSRFYLLAGIALVWGVAVIADSAQFSAIVSEVSRPGYVGTALTTQTALGFLLTVASIRTVAYIGEHWGWAWAAASMALGPALGIVAMLRLKRLEAASPK